MSESKLWMAMALIGGLACSGSKPDTAQDTGVESDADADADADADPSNKRVIGYFTEWGVYDRNYQVADIPTDKITHINYAFANATLSGGCEIYDSWAALEKDGGNYNLLQDLASANPDLKVLISLGGWTLSGEFSDIAASESDRQAFASDCVDFMLAYGFHGIDVDWEYPGGGGLDGNSERAEDTENFTLLLQELRNQLDLIGPDYLLTIAGPGTATKMAEIEMAEVGAIVDWVNVMTYDFHGGWDSQTGFNAPLHPASDSPFMEEATLNVAAAVQGWIGAGIPSDKVVMGAPIYGRGWSGVSANSNGLFQAASGLGTGTWEAGVYDYSDLVGHYIGQGDWERHWHNESLVPYLYSPSQTEWISYDDAESIGHKLDYIQSESLGGIMFWELSADTTDHELITLMANELLQVP